MNTQIDLPEQLKQTLEEAGGVVRGPDYVLLSKEAYMKLMGLTTDPQLEKSLSSLEESLRNGTNISVERVSRIAVRKAKKMSPSAKKQLWIDAQKRCKLSNAHIQMARELGMNPKKLHALSSPKDHPWKVPLPQFIEMQYQKRFKKSRPDNVQSIVKQDKERKRRRRERKAQQQAAKAQANESEE